MLPLKVPVYNGLIEKVSPSAYLLFLAWPINPGGEVGLRLQGYANVPDHKDLQHQPMDCRMESIKDGIYHLRIFFYYKIPKAFMVFPIKLGFVSYGPETDTDGMLIANKQNVDCNFLVRE